MVRVVRVIRVVREVMEVRVVFRKKANCKKFRKMSLDANKKNNTN